MKKKYQALILALAILALSGFLYKREKNPAQERYEARFTDVFDTVTEIVGYAGREEDFSEEVRLLKEQLGHYHKLYDIYHEYEGVNNLCTINRQAQTAPVKVDQEIIDLLKLGKEMYRETGGQVNIACGSVLEVWHQYREAGMEQPSQAQLPPMELLEERAGHTKMDDLIIDEEQSTVYLADPEMSLDVGSIGKGYAVQKAAEYARSRGMTHLLISAGGNVCAIGTRPDGAGWRVGVQNPDMDSSQTYVQTVEVSDLAVVTSGNYQRYYEVDGKRYCHIIDGDTQMPSDYVASVSVIGPDSGRADALSTALFNMEYEEGAKLVEAMQETEAMWILKDGSIRYSSGFEEYSRP